MVSKRARCSNWEHEEKVLLRVILRPHFDIIESKDLTTKTNLMKKRVWAEITEKFNKANVRARDTKQLINQWRLTKLKLKKNYKKKPFRKEVKPPNQEKSEDKQILIKKFKVESNMDGNDGMKELSTEDAQKDPIEFLNITMGEMDSRSAELSPSTSQETSVSYDHSPSESPSHAAQYPSEPLSPSQPVPSPTQRAFRKRFEKERSHMDAHYFRTRENNRLEEEHQLRMDTMTEFHKQTMKNLKLQEQIYEKILGSYSK